MAKKSTWINNDGLEVGYGPVVSDNLDAGTNHTKGLVKELEMTIDATNLPLVGAAHSSKDFAIPAGAYIVSARYISDVDFDFAVHFGTSQKDGTAIDADGLIAETLTSAVGAGALIGTTVTQESYLVAGDGVAAGGPATVGSGTLIVEYII